MPRPCRRSLADPSTTVKIQTTHRWIRQWAMVMIYDSKRVDKIIRYLNGLRCVCVGFSRGRRWHQQIYHHVRVTRSFVRSRLSPRNQRNNHSGNTYSTLLPATFFWITAPLTFVFVTNWHIFAPRLWCDDWADLVVRAWLRHSSWYNIYSTKEQTPRSHIIINSWRTRSLSGAITRISKLYQTPFTSTMKATTQIAALAAAAAVVATTNAFAPSTSIIISSSQHSTQLYAKGFGT